MDTYRTLGNSADGCRAFEIDNIYISLSTIACLIKRVAGVSNVQARKLFRSDQRDVHVTFNYNGKKFIVWEPYGDSSRYWIGPDDTDTSIEIVEIENVFKQHKPRILRRLLGDILMLRPIAGLRPREK